VSAPDRAACAALDAQDPIAEVRARFVIPDGVVYLDGNSLGALPGQTADRVRDAVETEWAHGLVRSWNDAGWMEAPRRVGAKVARLIGAADDEVIVGDSTTVCLYKLVCSALSMAGDRTALLTEEENFHTDLYVSAGAAEQCEATVRVVPRDQLLASLRDDVGVLLLTHVDYRSGFMHDMAAVSDAAHRAGALVIWDLSHSAGAVPLHVDRDGADMAVGCGYKYLNGGPGAPAFMHVRRDLQPRLRNPIPGWMGHADPFAFEPRHRPAEGMASMVSGTPPILQLAALECALDLWAEVGVDLARAKSTSLTQTFIALAEERCSSLGFTVASPRDPAARGSQVALCHRDGYGVIRALIERGVIGDYRAPDVCRFGFAPLYIRHVDVWDAVDAIVAVVSAGEHLHPRFAQRAAVT
jgi:kynureninase